METDTAKDRLQEAGMTAWRATILATAAILVLVFYLGMAFLVYRGELADGPLVLFTGVILGYLLRAIRDFV